MRKFYFSFFLLLLLGMQCLQAQDIKPVDSEKGLRQQLDGYTNGNIITFTLNIEITDVIEITKGMDVTINLHGWQLKRGLSAQPASAASGHVFHVHSGAKLTINNDDLQRNSSISGGYSDNGGGILNEGTVVMRNVHVTGNNASGYGAGIYNVGTMNLYDCYVEKNRADFDGGGIWNAGSLYMGNGAIADNIAQAGGAGLWSKGAVNLNGVTVSGNKNAVNGGGITNHGVMTVENCRINDNYATTSGGGIFAGKAVEGSQLNDGAPLLSLIGDNTITGNESEKEGAGIYYWDGKLLMGGKLVIKDNQFDNLYLTDGKKITVAEGGFSEGTSIYVKLATDGVFTQGYTQTEAEANRFFGGTEYINFKLVDGEVSGSLLGYKYLERSWDSDKKKIVEKIVNEMLASYHDISVQASGENVDKTLSGNDLYVISRDVTFGSIEIPSGNTSRLLLCNGATLTAAKGVHVPSDATLLIYGQEGDAGRLEAISSDTNEAGIGGHNKEKSGTIIIHGGNIVARGAEDGAGIGGGDLGAVGDVIIYGGTVSAQSAKYGAGIGCGRAGLFESSNKIEIYGGKVSAIGDYGAGIGTGDQMHIEIGETIPKHPQEGTIRVFGGEVKAISTGNGCAIGGGESSSGGGVIIEGGTVTAIIQKKLTGTIMTNYPIGGEGGLGWLGIADDLMMYAGENESSVSSVARADRDVVRFEDNCMAVVIKKCGHVGNTLELDEEGMGKLACSYCNYLKGETQSLDKFDEQTYNVQLTGRKIYKDGHWNTLCLPFSLTAEEIVDINKVYHRYKYNGWKDCQMMTLSGSDFDPKTGKLTLNFVQATNIEAGKPYIIKWDKVEGYDASSNIYNIFYQLFKNVKMEVALAGLYTKVTSTYADLVGNLSAVTLKKGDKSVLFFGNDDKVYYPSDDVKVGAFRAYIKLNGITAGDIEQQVQTIVLDMGDETTVIRTVNGGVEQESPDVWYTLDGRQLSAKPTAKGIYIHHGKKEVLH